MTGSESGDVGNRGAGAGAIVKRDAGDERVGAKTAGMSDAAMALAEESTAAGIE
jgi:hypothetical protein